MSAADGAAMAIDNPVTRVTADLLGIPMPDPAPQST